MDSMKTTDRPIICRETPPFDGDTQNLRPVGQGTAGVVFGLDSKRVVKIYLGTYQQRTGDMESERQAYKNLKPVENSCQHVLKCYDLENPHGLVLERCEMTVRRWTRSRKYEPQREALRLAVEAAKGLCCIHSRGIRQGDVGCRNMLLDSHGTLKIADFSGSSIDGCKYPASVDYEVGSKLPSETEPTIRADIFALGSAIYEIMTSKVPYKGKPYTEVQRLFKQEVFPDDFPKGFKNAFELRSVVERCWGKGGVFFKTAGQVLDALDQLGPVPRCSAAYFEVISKSKTPAVSKVHQESASPPNPQKEEQQAEKATRSPKTKPRKRELYVDSRRNKTRSPRHRNYREVIESPLKRRSHRQDHLEKHVNRLVDSFQTFFLGHARAPHGRRGGYYG